MAIFRGITTELLNIIANTKSAEELSNELSRFKTTKNSNMNLANPESSVIKTSNFTKPSEENTNKKLERILCKYKTLPKNILKPILEPNSDSHLIMDNAPLYHKEFRDALKSELENTLGVCDEKYRDLYKANKINRWDLVYTKVMAILNFNCYNQDPFDADNKLFTKMKNYISRLSRFFKLDSTPELYIYIAGYLLTAEYSLNRKTGGYTDEEISSILKQFLM